MATSPAEVVKATYRPSSLMEGPWWMLAAAGLPSPWTLIIWVVPATRSRTNTSTKPLVSPATRLDASLEKATYRPSGVMSGARLPPPATVASQPVAWPPLLFTLTRSVVPACRSRTKTSLQPLVSPDTRLVASESKAT